MCTCGLIVPQMMHFREHRGACGRIEGPSEDASGVREVRAERGVVVGEVVQGTTELFGLARHQIGTR